MVIVETATLAVMEWGEGRGESGSFTKMNDCTRKSQREVHTGEDHAFWTGCAASSDFKRVGSEKR